jgi:hypothetical protein
MEYLLCFLLKLFVETKGQKMARLLIKNPSHFYSLFDDKIF